MVPPGWGAAQGGGGGGVLYPAGDWLADLSTCHTSPLCDHWSRPRWEGITRTPLLFRDKDLIMQIPSIEPIRNSDLMHHVNQGVVWLNVSAQGANTTALSYAAFEFRLAVERLAIHYWATLLNRKIETRDLSDISSFKTVERRIYQLGGHQQEINRHFAFMNILQDAISISQKFLVQNIGKLSKHWHYCSEFCHIAWTLSSGDPQLCRKTNHHYVKPNNSSLFT
jgi:hypothetical protein